MPHHAEISVHYVKCSVINCRILFSGQKTLFEQTLQTSLEPMNCNSARVATCDLNNVDGRSLQYNFWSGHMRVANGPVWHDNCGRPRACYIPWIIWAIPQWRWRPTTAWTHVINEKKTKAYYVYRKKIVVHIKMQALVSENCHLASRCKSLPRLSQWGCVHVRLTSVRWLKFNIFFLGFSMSISDKCRSSLSSMSSFRKEFK